MNSNEPDEESLPVLFFHSKDVYEAMLRQSSKQPYHDGGEERVAVVYEGFLTKLFTEDLRLSVPLYSSVLAALKKMGCVAQLRRGGSTSPSQWQLFTEPTKDLFKAKVLGGKRRTGPASQYTTRLDQMEDMVAQLSKTVNQHSAILQRFIDEERETDGVPA
jgi:hypothetical protein